MRRSNFHGAASALLLSFACTGESAEQPSLAPPVAGTDLVEPPSPPAPPSWPAGQVCRVDADCGAARFCELRICVPGCQGDADCEAGATCDPHGRCRGDDVDSPALPLPPRLRDRRTVLEYGVREARTILYNDGPTPLDYRVTAGSPALLFDPAPSVIAPGGEAELVVSLDLAALTAADRVLPLKILTSGGAVAWSVELEGPTTSGHFAGSVLTGDDLLSLGSDRLAADLDFRPDGTILGRLDGEKTSVAWPHGVLTGTWTPAGDVVLELRDVTPAAPWQTSPLARPLGRRLTLAGTHTAAGIKGHAALEITGMRVDPVALAGTFALRRHGPLAGPVEPPPPLPVDPLPPTWLAPPELDDAACAGLGIDYGTPATLGGETVCPACADASCSSDEMFDCALDLWSAAFHLPEVVEGLAGQGQVKPPGGPWDWSTCTADEPTYEGGVTCHDAAAVRCAVSLLRRGATEIKGPWGETFVKFATLYAAEEAGAALLLATEAEIDAAFAYLGDLGEPTSNALPRELERLSSARETLAAALAPTLAPTYAASLADDGPPSPLVDATERAPLRLLADFAELTAAWATLAHRAGHDPGELREAVRHAAITVQAGALEVRARLTDDQLAAAQLDLLSLGPAMQALVEAHRDLAPGGSQFGVPAAYVPLALGPEDIAHHRTNFEAVVALAQDDVARFGEVASVAWTARRDYEEKVHALGSTALQLAQSFDAKLRELCGAEPGQTTPALSTCGAHTGRIAELRAAVEAAGLRIRHAAQAVENNLHAIAVEEGRFGKEVALALDLQAEIEAAQGQIFNVQDQAGEQRATLEQAAAAAECSRIRENADAEADVLVANCMSQIGSALFSGPQVLGVTIPNPVALAGAAMSCDANANSLDVQTENQCESVLAQAGLGSAREELARNEEQAIMAINAEIDAKIRASDLESRRAASVALVKNIRAEGLLLQIEVEEAQLARRTATTALWSAYQEVAALAQEKATAVGLMIEDSPDNARTRPHFLQAMLEAAGRVLRARELTTRRVYLALRALEYELNQDLPTLRAALRTARSPQDFEALLACMGTIAEDYKLAHGHGQPYVTEVSLRADLFGMTSDIPDVDGSPATPAEQFQALLLDPLHRRPDGSVALPFALSAFEGTLLSTWLCDDRIDEIEVKLVGDFLGDREAEVILTRQGLAGVRRCDGAELPPWSSYVPYSFDREQIVIQAGVNDWGTAGPNAGYAAWPVHGEQWTLTIPPGEQSPANADLDLRHVSDVVLRLHHRAGTLAPAGQGVFTPSCG